MTVTGHDWLNSFQRVDNQPVDASEEFLSDFLASSAFEVEFQVLNASLTAVEVVVLDLE
jgi:hypothetical protein